MKKWLCGQGKKVSGHKCSMHKYVIAGHAYSKFWMSHNDKYTLCHPTVPSIPLGLTLQGRTATSLQISWSPPSFINGANLAYRVEYRGVATENAVNDSFFVPNFLESTTTSVTISGLVPFSTYTIGVRASTSAGAGPTAFINASTAASGK